MMDAQRMHSAIIYLMGWEDAARGCYAPEASVTGYTDRLTYTRAFLARDPDNKIALSSYAKLAGGPNAK